MPKYILAINGGSSSLKTAIFQFEANPHRIASVRVERIGAPDARLTVVFEGQPPQVQNIEIATIGGAIDAILGCIGSEIDMGAISGVGHRVVHGGPKYTSTQLITPDLLADLRTLEPFDPEHLPAQVNLIELLQQRMPSIPHVACFDTAFHRELPPVAKRLPIPRKFDAIGVRRYGFHGLSYSYLMDELRRIDPKAAEGRVVLAHLGNGASLAAVRNGRCIDTSMSLTPCAGIPMGTRSGDLDPGLMEYLLRVGGVTVEQFNRMVHLESGLLGISETTSDMQKLMELASTDVRAAEAVDIFCYQVRKCIGAYAAALDGLDTLIFAGGIGELSPQIRFQACQGLRFLGIELDEGLNANNVPVISKCGRPVTVRVLATDEEQVIAREVIDTIS